MAESERIIKILLELWSRIKTIIKKFECKRFIVFKVFKLFWEDSSPASLYENKEKKEKGFL